MNQKVKNMDKKEALFRVEKLYEEDYIDYRTFDIANAIIKEMFKNNIFKEDCELRIYIHNNELGCVQYDIEPYGRVGCRNASLYSLRMSWMRQGDPEEFYLDIYDELEDDRTYWSEEFEDGFIMSKVMITHKIGRIEDRWESRDASIFEDKFVEISVPYKKTNTAHTVVKKAMKEYNNIHMMNPYHQVIHWD